MSAFSPEEQKLLVQAEYGEFLREKIKLAPKKGFDVPLDQINPNLKPHTRDIVRWALAGGQRAIFASFGLHKCHGAGTPIMKIDGQIVPVEQIAVGDLLMGSDSQPRRVLELAHGREMIYRITLKNGDSYTCNESHVLSLKVSNKYGGHQKGAIVNMPLREFLALPEYAKRNCFKHYKVPVSFEHQSVPMDPYLYGAWLGDGSRNRLDWCINHRDTEIVDAIRQFAQAKGLRVRETPGRGCSNYHITQGNIGQVRQIDEFYFVQGSYRADGKRIDRRYLMNDRDTRLQVLAGIVDTDGNLKDGCLRIGTKWAGLRDDILFLSRSLGLAASHGSQTVNGVEYYTICLSGHTDMVPCRTRKKALPRRQIKDPLVYGFSVVSIGVGEYFGFELDGDHLYLLGDFTVTHNTATNLEVMRQIGVHRAGVRRLIIMPLGVRQEFAREVRLRFTGDQAIELKFIKSSAEVGRDDVIYVTNYEPIRDGKIDPKLFDAVALDEAAILRSFGSKTFQEFLNIFEHCLFKFVYTATPSPNRLKELIHYAGFLGVMDTGQALTRFFQRDSEKAGNLTLYPHKVHEFWLWVASWALYLQKPSDLGHSDEGYVLPPLDLQVHELASNYEAAGNEKNGQGLLIPNVAMGLSAAAGEKRESLSDRVAKVVELLAQRPAGAQAIVWCDLNDEQRALEKAIVAAGWTVSSLDGSQEQDVREQLMDDWRERRTDIFLSKPVMYGAGPNLQQCQLMIFAGIGFKFADFIQAVHRILRFGQTGTCTVHLIHTEVERAVLAVLMEKWRLHDDAVAMMGEIIREYGLDQLQMQDTLARTIGVQRQVAVGEHFTVANNDCVLEALEQPDNSVGMILTSIPFGNMYEYSPSYNDFGHTVDNDQFWRQMDFLTPQLLRILQPGRIYACHVKDRILFGNVTGAGVPTVSPFHAEAIFHARKHGFDYMGMITVVTDVVRENNQTYRLGYSEVCKDGTKMGVGMPEYILLFHKPQTDRSRGYADVPVTKAKPLCTDEFGAAVAFDRKLPPIPGTGYSVARWQVDAHAFWRSSGDRLLGAAELAAYGPGKLAKLFTELSLTNVYDYELHVATGEHMLANNALPATYMSLAPGSSDPAVWHDIVRMRTLNGEQSARAVENHVCPFQIDIVDRLINRYTNPGDVVYDPFHGLGTVGVRAVKLGRRGAGSELNAGYFRDQVHYLQLMEREVGMPTLFDMVAMDQENEK